MVGGPISVDSFHQKGERRGVLRVIRNQATRLYLRDDGNWTAECHEAKPFLNIQAVVSTVQRFQLKKVELVLQIGDNPSPQYDVVFPLLDGQTNRFS